MSHISRSFRLSVSSLLLCRAESHFLDFLFELKYGTTITAFKALQSSLLYAVTVHEKVLIS